MRFPIRSLGAAAGLSLAVYSSHGYADGVASRIGVQIEGGVAHTLDPHNGNLFGFGAGGALYLEINPHPLIGFHLGGSALWLSREQSSDAATWYGGRAGLRFHWGHLLSPTSMSDGWLDAHYAFGVSGGIARSGFDIGLGYEIGFARSFRAGPMVRLQWASDPRSDDPLLLTFGLSVGILGDRASRESGRTPDSDRDGVNDPDDHCPAEPMGATPDPTRRGCPARDTDSDGVSDSQDICPTVPAGAHSDTARRGCPAQDTDADGVVDGSDLCPTTPAGGHPDPARPGCPAADQDSDGVFDSDDQCPTVPAGARPDPRRRGCPVADRDNDTVADEVDHCPDQAGAPSTDPRRNGCPGLVRIDENQIRILRPVFFATNADVILDASYPVLAAVADALQATGIQSLRIEGHSDNRGNPERNRSLSQRRAESIRRWLIGHSISPGILTAQGVGDARPVEPNNTPLGRAANRRVEFHIVALTPSGAAPSGRHE